MIGAIGLLASVDGLAVRLEQILLKNVRVTNANELAIEQWVPYSIVAFLAIASLMLLVGTAFTIIAITNLKSNLEAAKENQRRAPAQDLIKGLLNANREIVDKLYTAEDYPEYLFEEAVYIVEIGDAGNGKVMRRERLRARSASVSFWTQGMFVDPEADGVDNFADITFTAVQVGGIGKVVPLPVADDPRGKRVALFHLPKIEAGESEPRTVETKYEWPGLMKKLVQTGAADWSWTLWSAEPVKRFEAGFYFHPNIGQVECSQTGLIPKGAKLELAKNAQGWVGWRYTCDHARADRFKYSFEFRLKVPPL